jgi:WD40 repeat protein
VCFSPDGKRLAGAGDDKTVKVWEMTGDREPLTLTGHTARVTAVVFLPEDRVASASIDGTLRVWDLAKGQSIHTFGPYAHGLTDLALSADGRRLAFLSVDFKLRMWDTVDGGEPVGLDESQQCRSVAFGPDGRLATGMFDGSVHLWDAQLSKKTLVIRGHTGLVQCVAFSPDGSRLASGGEDHTVKVWDGQSGLEALTLKGHTALVNSVAFSPDGRRLASASRDGTVRIYDAPREIHEARNVRWAVLESALKGMAPK